MQKYWFRPNYVLSDYEDFVFENLHKVLNPPPLIDFCSNW